MKKLYFLLASMMLFTTAQARELTFKYHDEVIENNATIKCIESDIETEDTGAGFEVMIYPKLTLTSDMMASNLVVTFQSLTGAKVQSCMGGDCQLTDKNGMIEKTISVIQANSPLDLELEYMDFVEKLSDIPNISVKVSVADAKNPSTNRSFTIVMYTNDAGVEVIENNKAFYSVKGGFAYDLPGEATVTLYNANGSVYGSYKLSGNGTLSTEGMPAGIYLFTVEGKGISTSGKVAL